MSGELLQVGYSSPIVEGGGRVVVGGGFAFSLKAH